MTRKLKLDEIDHLILFNAAYTLIAAVIMAPVLLIDLRVGIEEIIVICTILLVGAIYNVTFTICYCFNRSSIKQQITG